MNALYRVTGMSKQAFHQYLDREMLVMEEQQQLLPILSQIRADHPRLSARKMYLLLQPVSMGRDRFEQFCYSYGFKLAVKRSYHRTTDSLGVTRFENLIIGMELTGINQAWASDITYYRIGERFYYITFILDLYSRFIVGYAASNSLLTSQTTIPALRMALRSRNPDYGLIFHSDGGGQYYSKAFLAITQGRIRNSMCESVYENAHAERINGTIKNDYLVCYAPHNYQQLVTLTAKAVHMYNNYRPHSALNNKTPWVYESSLTSKLINKEKRSKKEKGCGNMENSVEFTTFPQLQ